MKNYKCESCNKIFKQKSHYDKHVNNKKNHVNPQLYKIFLPPKILQNPPI